MDIVGIAEHVTVRALALPVERTIVDTRCSSSHASDRRRGRSFVSQRMSAKSQPRRAQPDRCKGQKKRLKNRELTCRCCRSSRDEARPSGSRTAHRHDTHARTFSSRLRHARSNQQRFPLPQRHRDLVSWGVARAGDRHSHNEGERESVGGRGAERRARGVG